MKNHTPVHTNLWNECRHFLEQCFRTFPQLKLRATFVTTTNAFQGGHEKKKIHKKKKKLEKIGRNEKMLNYLHTREYMWLCLSA